MNAFDAEMEVRRRKAEARATGDQYMQLGDFNRPRRRPFLGALLAALGRLFNRAGQLPPLDKAQGKMKQLPL